MDYYSILRLECKNAGNGIDGCWEETHIQLAEGETKQEGIYFLRSIGWEIVNEICPFCSKGIRENESKLKRVK